MKRVGIIEVSVDTVKVIGFGGLNGTCTVYDDDLGLDVSATKVLLDNGTEFLVKDSIIGDEDAILKNISEYKAKGYKLI
jgi:hypothetical protein